MRCNRFRVVRSQCLLFVRRSTLPIFFCKTLRCAISLAFGDVRVFDNGLYDDHHFRVFLCISLMKSI